MLPGATQTEGRSDRDSRPPVRRVPLKGFDRIATHAPGGMLAQRIRKALDPTSQTSWRFIAVSRCVSK